MARPRKAERRTRQINIKLTEREQAWLHGRAKASGMRPAEFGRDQLLADRHILRKPPETGRHLDPLFLSQLSRIGNNLNQLTRRCHLLNVPPPASLEPLLQLIRDMLRKAVAHGS